MTYLIMVDDKSTIRVKPASSFTHLLNYRLDLGLRGHCLDVSQYLLDHLLETSNPGLFRCESGAAGSGVAAQTFLFPHVSLLVMKALRGERLYMPA